MTRFVEDYLLYLLAQASANASAEFHAQLANKGIPVSTWRILASLFPDAELGVTELAKACLSKQSTMTRQIDRLAAQGMVDRTADQNDRRRVAVRLTEKGRALAVVLTSEAKAHEQRILNGLPPGDIDAMKAALVRLAGP